MSSSPQIVPFAPHHLEAYLGFARDFWGDDAYQGRPRYLRWLYDRSPLGRDRCDVLLAVRGAEVLGCIHKMRLLWHTDDGLVEIPTLHNWAVAAADRTGLGLMLLTRAVKGESHAFVPAAEGELAQLYRKLKWQEIPSLWQRRLVRPTASLLRLGLVRMLGDRVLSRFHRRALLRTATPFAEGEVLVTTSPGLDLRETFFQTWQHFRPGGTAPQWDRSSFAWRFFDPIGPAHVAVHGPVRRGLAPFVLFSVGYRKGLLVGRLLTSATPDGAALSDLVQAGERALARLGVHALLVYTTADAERQALGLDVGAPRYGSPSFMFHADRQRPFAGFAASAAAADFGFESMASWD